MSIDVFNPDGDVIFLVEQDANNPDKRYAAVTDISFSSTDNSINSTTTDLSVYDVGDRVHIQGSDSNEGGWLVESVTPTKLVCDSSPDTDEYGDLGLNTTITTEAAGDTIRMWAIQTLRWTDGENGFDTKVTDAPGAVLYDARVDDPGNYERLAYAKDTELGAGDTSQGDIVLNNTDNDLDYLVYDDWGFDGQRTKIKMGSPDDYYDDFTLVRSMTAEGVSQDEQVIRIKIHDFDAVFDKSLVTTKYAGTNSGSTGNEGTESDIKGNPKPIIEGPFENEKPVTCNTSAPRYQIEHRGAIISIRQAMDGGSVILASNYTVDYMNGIFAPVASPARDITLYGHGYADIPTDGLELWLDALAVETVTESSLEISAVADKSAEGNDATQGTGAAKPDYVANVGSMGVPGFNFDGGDQLTLASSISLSGTTTFAAVRSGSTNSLNNAVVGTGAIGASFTGVVFEVLHYARVLSADEEERVERYLETKWGIKVAGVPTYFSAPETVRRLVINQYGRDWDLHFNQAVFEALAEDQPAAVRTNIIDQEIDGSQLLNSLMRSIGGGWSHNNDGKLEVYRLVAPENETPVLYLTDTEIDNIQVEDITDQTGGLPINEVVVLWGPIGTTQTSGELATGIGDDVRSFVQNKHRKTFAPTTGPDPDVLAAHPFSKSIQIETQLDKSADAIDEADRLLDLHKLRRRLYRVTIIAPIIQVDVNAVINISTDNDDFGLAEGKNVVVLTVNVQSASNTVEMLLWG